MKPSSIEAAYHTSTFYGPLEQAKRHDEFGSALFKHPNDPTKLVREGREGQYYDKAEMDVRVSEVQQVLDGLTRHDIKHVNPLYSDTTSGSNGARLTIIVDKVEHDASINLTTDPGAIAASDRVLTQLFGYAVELARQGGHVDPEMMHLEQFVYDGQDMVLVDVEPIGAELVEAERESVDNYGIPSSLLFTVARLTVDALSLKGRVDNPTSLRAAATAIAALPGDSTQTNQAKMLLLAALDAGEVSLEVERLARGQMINDQP